MAENLLMKIYPYIAKQIINDYGIKKGICLDIGTGPGYLGIELAKITNLEVYLVDIDPEAVKISKKNAKKAGVKKQTVSQQMNVEEMKFKDCFAHLIVSRGSFWFWDNKAKGLKEIHRVLKPGGIALIGGGLGRNLPEKYRKPLVEKRMNRKDDEHWKKVRSKEFMENKLNEAGINSYNLIYENDVCRWAEIKKSKGNNEYD